jgi:hypothetical protein
MAELKAIDLPKRPTGTSTRVFSTSELSRPSTCVEEAWLHAGPHSCFSCYNTWLNENRAVFDLHPSVLGNFWANYLRPRSGPADPAPASGA